MAHAIGSVRLYPNVRTILDIGGKDSKIILINNGVVSDYSINSLCSSGTGSFISSFAKRLGVSLEEVSSMALKSKNIVDISSRCVVFAETDMIDKIQKGYKKEDIFAGICRSVSVNYINSIVKGKKIKGPILFNGGVSKNKAVVNNLEELIGEKIIVDKNSHLMGAFGMALMARECNTENVFDFDIDNLSLETKVILCEGCSNNCEIVTVYRNNQIIDCWGNHCEKGDVFKKV
jgi:predicted CoA-substrate-specific enzyme activase